jgi:hypothetical protein
MLLTNENDYSSSTVRSTWSTTCEPLGIDFASLSGVQSNSLWYLGKIEEVIELEQMTATSFSLVIEADNLCLSGKRQIDHRSIMLMPSLKIMIFHFVIEILDVWWTERYQRSYFMKWITHHVRFLKLLISEDGDSHSSWSTTLVEHLMGQN